MPSSKKARKGLSNIQSMKDLRKEIAEKVPLTDGQVFELLGASREARRAWAKEVLSNKNLLDRAMKTGG